MQQIHNRRLPGGNSHLRGDLKLNEIVFLGAHNCAMASCYGWFYSQQSVSLTEQYEKYGVRHFKVPLHWYQDKGEPQIVVAHEEDGTSNCQLSLPQRGLKAPERAAVRLREIIDLAYKYDLEVIVLKLESKLHCNSTKNGTQGWDAFKVAEKIHNLLVEIRAEQRAIIFQGEAPTLQWCRYNQKNILITIQPSEQVLGELKRYVHFAYDISSQVDWRVDPLKEVTSGEIARGNIGNPFFQIHLNSENSLNQTLNIFQKNKYNSYAHVRKRFLAFNHHCKKMPNFIAADFVDQGDLTQLVDDVNDIINENGKFIPEKFKEK